MEEAHPHPGWYDEIASSLAVHSQIVISGNTRDLYVSPGGPQEGFLTLEQTLWRILNRKRIVALLIHDPVDGLRLSTECDSRLKKLLAANKIELGKVARTPDDLANLHKRITELRTVAVALVLDYSSHLGREKAPGLNEFFLRVHKSAYEQLPPRPQLAAHAPYRNPTIWITDQPADLPDWFTTRNDMLREIHADVPDLEDRFVFAQTLLPKFRPVAGLDAKDTERLLEQFALQCDGETLVAMESIAQMACSEGMNLAQIGDAIAMYRTGIKRNPWKSPVLRSRMQKAHEILTERVLGQEYAVDKTLDILMRSVAGLSGAQTGGRHTRPRGVLLFAGPTGVGKTELAKSVTELLFGDEKACHRFDMSEFIEQDSVSRLIGAPPGQPGHERGGELINALHKRPFSVFLFDEIEKAHPRILDMFLQILDEGRLTDARGATAFFSEALIIFTSNIGMFGTNRADNMGMNVMPSDPHDVLVRKITKSVQDYFRFELKRPELMNRIGQNVVVFDFIGPTSQKLIFRSLMQRVLRVVSHEQDIDVRFTDQSL
ncbi:MAG: ATP-dependent Clp protease ATP-binding subunit, partial [Anderseniella sp.]|nr:ATP-dependent Clp protease ATP-binding subunit [Anderseniella sp.]